MVASEPVFRLPDFEKPLELRTDASDRAIRGVVVQKGHPVAFESRKLKDAKMQYFAHEKEMSAMIRYLLNWRHFFLGTHFVLRIDNMANTFFKTQKKLTRNKQGGRSTLKNLAFYENVSLKGTIWFLMH